MSNNNYLLTFHMTWSYGACLQAFATLEALKNVGCKAEILNFINPYERKGNETPFQLIKDGDFKAGLIAAAKNIIFQRAKLHARAFKKSIRGSLERNGCILRVLKWLILKLMR